VLIIAILCFGFAAGWVAQLLLGMGSRPDGRTLAAGLAGSFVGGLVTSLVAGDGLALRPSGVVGSIAGATLVLLAWRALDRSRSAR
jgi:uncharacterized membrane protein YeaQ/YmgE (transglycosylase-associated protein family)